MKGLRGRGRPRHAPRTVELVGQLLAEGLSIRGVVTACKARGVSVSQTNVWQIRNGCYPWRPPDEGPRVQKLEKKLQCPVCGYVLVQLPCVLCLARKANESEASRQIAAFDASYRLEIELDDEDRARLEEIRLRRMGR